MFSTLDLSTGTKSAAHSSAAGAAGQGEESEGGTTASASASASRPKRNQVRRACDWCKLMRIKCDTERPCYNCQQGRRECGMSNKNPLRSLAAAVKEVENLRAQISELEASKRQLEDSHKSASSTGSAERPLSRSQLNSSALALAERQTASRNGVRVGFILWGMASLPFFLVRLDEFLRAARPHLDIDMLACATGTPTSSPWLRPDALTAASFLPIFQERHFLSLFWKTHYFTYPLLNEAHFRREYHELTAECAPSATRRASPLVDIVLALCIQLGSLRLSRAATDAQKRKWSSSLAGFQYYRRGQEAIDQTIETPNLHTVQCYVYSIIYLFEAGFLNRAQVVAGKAITVAMLIGLSHEPPLEVPEPEREVARRTWWSLYALDTLLSMEVGRPPMISASHSTCQLPTDSFDVAQWLGSHYRHDDACPLWVGFQTQTLYLLQAVRKARAAFNARYDAVVGQNGYEVFVDNGKAREECAQALMEPIKEIDRWVRNVASGYVVQRKEGHAFSRERFTLDLDHKPNVLIHCQRQRLLLEMQYYYQCMAIYRPFICVGATAVSAVSSTPLSDGMAETGLSYAIALTNMIYQALTGSEALRGAYNVFGLQKNALFTIIGFAYTFPLTQREAVRKALEEGLFVVEMYQDALPDARAVAASVRALSDDLSTVMGEFYDESGWSSSSWLASGTPSTTVLSSASDTMVAAGLGQDGSAPGSLIPTTTSALEKQGFVSPAILSDSPGLMTEGMFDFNAFDMSGWLDSSDMGTGGGQQIDLFWGGMNLGEPGKEDPWAMMMDMGTTSDLKNNNDDTNV